MESGPYLRKFLTGCLSGAMPLLQQHVTDIWAWSILIAGAALTAFGVQTVADSKRRKKE